MGSAPGSSGRKRGAQTAARGTCGDHTALPRIPRTACVVSLIVLLTFVSASSSIERCVTPVFNDVPSRTLAASLVLEVRAPARLRPPLEALRGAARGSGASCDVVFKVRQVLKGRLTLKEPPLVQERLPLVLVSLCDPGPAGSPAGKQGPSGGPADYLEGNRGETPNLPSAKSNASLHELHGDGFSEGSHRTENETPARAGAAVGGDDCESRVLPHGLEANYLLFVHERKELGTGLNSSHAQLPLPYIRLGSAPEHATKRHVTEVNEYSCAEAKCGGKLTTALLQPQLHVAVEPRRRLQLVCRTTGRPPPRVDWLKNGEILIPASQTGGDPRLQVKDSNSLLKSKEGRR